MNYWETFALGVALGVVLMQLLEWPKRTIRLVAEEHSAALRERYAKYWRQWLDACEKPGVTLEQLQEANRVFQAFVEGRMVANGNTPP